MGAGRGSAEGRVVRGSGSGGASSLNKTVRRGGRRSRDPNQKQVSLDRSFGSESTLPELLEEVLL